MTKKMNWEKKLEKNREGSNRHYLQHTLHNTEECFIVNKSSKTPKHYKHCFNNQHKALLIKDKATLMIEIYNYIDLMNEGWKPNWNDFAEIKYGILIEYEGGSGSCKVSMMRNVNSSVFGLVCKERNIANGVVREFGDDLIKNFCKQ